MDFLLSELSYGSKWHASGILPPGEDQKEGSVSFPLIAFID